MPSPRQCKRQSKEVSIITLSDSEDEAEASSSYQRPFPSINNKVDDKTAAVSPPVQISPVKKSATENATPDDSILIIENNPQEPENPEVIPLSLDDSVLVINPQSHKENVPKLKQWYCRDVTATRKRKARYALKPGNKVTMARQQRHATKLETQVSTRSFAMPSSGSDDLDICEVTSTTEEPAPKNPDFIPLSLDDSVVVLNCLPHNVNVPEVKQRYCPEETVSCSDDLDTCNHTSTTGESSLEVTVSTKDKRVVVAHPRIKKSAPDFIPLTTKRKRSPTTNLLSKKKKLDTSSKNKSIPLPLCPTVPPVPRRLRPVVIDGSNVARMHGTVNKTFSCKGIQICVDYFLNRGHTQVTCFVPLFRRSAVNRRDHPTVDPDILEKLAEKQIVVFTPSRKLNGRCLASYDDRFMVQLASQNGGVIVSNDNYRDLVDEDSAYKAVIEERLIPFCFVGDIFMPAHDPLGLDGPCLNDVLTFGADEPPSL